MTSQKPGLPAAILVIASMLIPVCAFPQAAASYAGAASHSTGMTAKAASQIRSRGSVYTQQPLAPGKLTIPAPSSKNLEAVMEENRQKLEKDSEAGGGLVEIESNPEKATVSVDGNPVGFAPMEIKLPEGTHLVELTHPGCDSWQMEVAVNAHESTSVTARLEKKYKSSVTISFQ